MIKIGVTERGDAGLDFSWVDKLPSVAGAIIISKNLNDNLIRHLLDNKNKVIFHLTCTGYGNSELEPNVPSFLFSDKQLKILIDRGFPTSHIVLRVDPIIPSSEGIEAAIAIMDVFMNSYPLQRIRYSFMDSYPHIVARGLHIPKLTQALVDEFVAKAKPYDSYLETCAEPLAPKHHQAGCISIRDFLFLGLDPREIVDSSGRQRSTCLCLGNKVELLNNRKRCPHGCIYCYWKD